MIVSKTIRNIINTAIPPIVADMIIIVVVPPPPGIALGSGILVDLLLLFMTEVAIGLSAIV